MGQESSGITRIQELSKSLALVHQAPGERTYVSRATDEEYLIIKRLISSEEKELEAALARRKKLHCRYVPELIEFARDCPSYCSDITVMQVLFRQPAKSLREEKSNRAEVGEWFEEGEIFMIGYCALLALEEFRKMGDSYEVAVSDDTLLIQMNGNIVLSDAGKYREQIGQRKSLRRIKGENGRILQRSAMIQLGNILSTLLAIMSKCTYSESLSQFVALLQKGEFQLYEQAICHLAYIKKAEHSVSTKVIKNITTLNSTPDHGFRKSSTSPTPIGELLKLIDNQEPLGEITNRVLNKCKPKKRESKCHVFKQKFRASKTQAFAEQQIHQQLQDTLKIDEISSIEERHKITQSDELQDIEFMEQEYVSKVEMEPNLPLCPKIELFWSNRPYHLKQLVLNQKGIIYEESADDLSSLASQRTHRLHNAEYLGLQ